MNCIAKFRSIQRSINQISSTTSKSLAGRCLSLSSTNNTTVDFSKNHFDGKRYVSSFSEPQPTLFDTSRISDDLSTSDVDKQLRADVKTMGSILGATIKSYEGEDVLNKVESLRLSAKVR